MQIPKNWLFSLFNNFLNIKKIFYLLNISGFEIEKIKINKPIFSKIIIGKIINLFIINNLYIYKVYIKKKNIFLLYNKCNINKNIKIFCLISKKNIKIKKNKYIKIHGIICTEKILKISKKNIFLKLINIKNNNINKNIFNYFSFLRNNIYLIKLNPNRFDCSSILGISREISLLNNILIKKNNNKLKINDLYKIPIKFINKNICARFVGRIIKNININIKTPLWIIKRLKDSNIKISNFIITNIINYSIIELGQLFNIIDINKIYKNLNIKINKKKNILKISKNIKIYINNNNIITCDNKKIISLIGIINNYNNLNKYFTKNIYIECYFLIPLNDFFFKKYIFHNEIFFKIKKIIDFSNLIKNIEKISKLIIKICGNKNTKIGLINDNIINIPIKKYILFNIKNIKKYLGIKLNIIKIKKIFKKINLKYIKNYIFFILIPPFYRYDLFIKEDIIEEIARIYGFHKINSLLLNIKINFLKIKKKNKKTLLEIHNLIKNTGYNEVINYTFINYKWEYLLNNKNVIKIINPISNKLNVLRSSLIPGLIKNLLYNIKYNINNIKLFEIGNIFINYKNKSNYKQIKKLACIYYNNNFDKKKNNFNYLNLKSDLEFFFYPNILKFKNKFYSLFNYYISAKIILNKITIGIIGELNLKLTNKYNLYYSPSIFEIDISYLKYKKIPKYSLISKFPILEKDITLIVNKYIKIQKIFDIFKKNKKKKYFFLIKKIIFLNEYYNIKYKNYKKNLTFKIIFKNKKKLNKINIKKIIKNIIQNIYKKIT